MTRAHRRGAAVALLVAVSAARSQQAPASPAPTPPTGDYLVFVASEGNDHIALVRFGPHGARVERDHRIGNNPTELVGPHGIAVSPDGAAYVVTTAHGAPNGALWKFSTANDEQLGRVTLGLFPATVAVSRDGQYAWLVNFALYGAMTPSSVSVVYVDGMVEVKRIPTCVMPHGSRLSPDGGRQYSACMMNDAVIEIDTRAMAVSRHLMLAKGMEHGGDGLPPAMAMGPTQCSPTWAQPAPDGRRLWIACNKSSELVEIDLSAWTVTRRIPAGNGVYNLAASHDGRLVVGTNKRGQSVSVFDAASGAELTRIPTSRRVPSGVVISPDDRYAFVTLEGVGSEPGTVDVIDLRARVRVASADVGQQAGGIDFWKYEPSPR